MEKFKQKYRISSARLAHWDYGSPGLYFVTICTKNRDFYFGEITVETQNFASLYDAQRTSIKPTDSNNAEIQNANIQTQNISTETQNMDAEMQNFASLYDAQRPSIKSTDSNKIIEIHNANPEPKNINTEAQNFASLHDTQRPSIKSTDSNKTIEIHNANPEPKNINTEAQNFASLHDAQRPSIKPTDSNATIKIHNANPEPKNINTETQNFASLYDAQRPSIKPTDSNATIEMDNANIEPENMYTETQNMNTETQNFASLRATAVGNIANQYWLDIPKHFPFVELDEYVVMPNHVHGILFINKPDFHGWQRNKFGPQSQNLGSIIRGYKAGVKTFATTNQIEFGWQPRFHDHIIRSEKELNNIRKYIISNPDKWHLDKSNPENLMM